VADVYGCFTAPPLPLFFSPSGVLCLTLKEAADRRLLGAPFAMLLNLELASGNMLMTSVLLSNTLV
jgi:hypothetical protein